MRKETKLITNKWQTNGKIRNNLSRHKMLEFRQFPNNSKFPESCRKKIPTDRNSKYRITVCTVPNFHQTESVVLFFSTPEK